MHDIPTEIALPSTTCKISREAYFIEYDPRTKNPIYVYEKLSSDCLQSRVNRNECQFKEDKLIPQIFRSSLKDYAKSGYDRGHLACAANHSDSYKDLSDTFFLSNISPQDQSFNRGYWAKLEKYVRNLTKEHKYVEVFTGPLFLPKEENGIKIVSYRVIGENDIAVPTHFYKVIFLKDSANNSVIEAYIMPNENIPSNTSLIIFKTTLEKLQKAAGVLFFNEYSQH